MNSRQLEAGRELDALVAEKVMGVSLIPPREAAMVRVAGRHVCATGPEFELRDGRKFRMPPGRELKQPEGTDDWNARYFLFIAQQVGSEWDAQIAAERDIPSPFSTDIAAAWEVVEKLTSTTKQWFRFEQSCVTHEAIFSVEGAGGLDGEWRAEAETAPLAICRAALQAVTVAKSDS